jgi:hypothetical protein
VWEKLAELLRRAPQELLKSVPSHLVRSPSSVNHTLAWSLIMCGVLLLTPTTGGVLDALADWFGGNVATLSDFVLTTSAAVPAFGWALCWIIGVFPGHCLTVKPYPRPFNTYLTVALVAGVPYVFMWVVAVLRFAHPVSHPFAETSRQYPTLFAIWFLCSGYLVSAWCLHQTE